MNNANIIQISNCNFGVEREEVIIKKRTSETQELLNELRNKKIDNLVITCDSKWTALKEKNAYMSYLIKDLLFQLNLEKENVLFSPAHHKTSMEYDKVLCKKSNKCLHLCSKLNDVKRLESSAMKTNLIRVSDTKHISESTNSYIVYFYYPSDEIEYKKEHSHKNNKIKRIADKNELISIEVNILLPEMEKGVNGMERLWLGEARKKYPNQWIIAVNIVYDEKNKAYGDIYFVTSDKDEAYSKAFELKTAGNMGKVSVTEGVSDVPQIGGLMAWNR